jgi:hyperosmotically inducible protein
MCIAALATVAPLAACDRADTRAQTQQASAELKAAAAKAGDRLTDGWLTTKIQAEYFADKNIKGRYIDVSTRDRHVTIDGYVDSEVQRQQAEQIARQTSGVAAVENRLKIGVAPADVRRRTPQDEVGTSGEDHGPAASGGHVDDDLVTSMIQAKFFQDPEVKTRDIDVSTRNGVVTLRGEVASAAERAQALRLARETQGVQRVEDALRIRE